VKQAITIGTVFFIGLWFYPYTMYNSLKKVDQYHVDRWWSKEVIVMIIASLLIAIALGKRLHWSVAPGVASTLISGSWIANWKRFLYMKYGYVEKIGFRYLGADQALIFLLVVGSLSTLSKEILHYIAKAMAMICIAQSLWIISKFFYHYAPYSRTGFISNNASMDATIIAMTFPFVLAWKHLNAKTGITKAD